MVKFRIWLVKWLRRVIGMDREKSVAKKLEAIRVAAEHEFPAGDIDSMLAEIEEPYT